MNRLLCLAMLSMALLAPRTAVSQEEDAPQGATSLSIRPLGSTTIGVWHQFTPRLEVGLEVGGTVAHQEGDEEESSEGRVFVGIEPTAKVYGAPRGDLRPYTAGSLFFTSQEFDYVGDQKTSFSSLGATLGMGLEWSPVERVRIGGHAGVSASYEHGERTAFNLGIPEVYEVDGWEVGTFTTGVTFYYSF